MVAVRLATSVVGVVADEMSDEGMPVAVVVVEVATDGDPVVSAASIVIAFELEDGYSR